MLRKCAPTKSITGAALCSEMFCIECAAKAEKYFKLMSERASPSPKRAYLDVLWGPIDPFVAYPPGYATGRQCYGAAKALVTGVKLEMEGPPPKN